MRRLRTDIFVGDFLFVISDFSLVGEGCLDEFPLFNLIRFTVLFEVDETIELRGMTGPLAILIESYTLLRFSSGPFLS